jgi:M6 family metalloprotease-like protein
LVWFKDAKRDGTVGWAAGSGGVIGGGWQPIRLAFAAPNGVIYAADTNGSLFWYRDAVQNGTVGWAGGSQGRIGSDWINIRLAFASSDGIIYAIHNNGRLLWYRDLHNNGTPGWAQNSGNTIGSGWQGWPYAMPGKPGMLYGVNPSGLLHWYRDVPRNGMPGWGPGSGNQIGSGWLDVEWKPTLRQFGHGSMLASGRPALGTRPLVTILAQYDDNGMGAFPAFSSVHPIEYYQKLSFANPNPPYTTQNPVNPASLAGYFDECSLGRFSLVPGALVGTLSMGPFGNDPGPEQRARKIIEKAAQQLPQLFVGADQDSDSFVVTGEMQVLIVENISTLQPANRQNAPAALRLPWPLSTLNKTISVAVAFAGPLTPFYQIAHETSHSLGTRDMYNSGAGNALLTLMGRYSFYGNDQGTVHFDAWHKCALGWCEPTRRRLTRPGDEVLLEISRASPAAAMLLWHPARGTSEYFLIERRKRTGSRRYDSGFPGDGALIWRVNPGADPCATHLGSPALSVGGNTVWSAGQQTPPLKWSDGSPVGTRLRFTQVPAPLPTLPPWLKVSWDPAV